MIQEHGLHPDNKEFWNSFGVVPKVDITRKRLEAAITDREAQKVLLGLFESSRDLYIDKPPVILDQNIRTIRKIVLPYLGRRIGGLTTALKKQQNG
jgi:hypothetical protein